MSDIVVKFKPQGQKALIQAIKQLEKAKAGYVGMTKKANVTVAQMTSKLAAQNLTWKKLGVDIKVVTAAARGNRLAMDKLQLAVRKGTKANAGLLTSQRLLDNSFATLRSHMLLFSFAMSLGVRQVVRMTKEAAKLQQMERAFGGLSGGATNASVAIEKLKEATNGTLSEFDLFQQANNAMILGVTKNSDEMAQMFDMAQRLGAALGRDTASSIESLVTGIGRQSRLMLDNIGIIVKADQAYSSYAAELGTTADNLTKSEKQQAFMNAALEAANEALLDLPEEILNADQRFQALSASLNDASKSIGQAFLPMAEKLAIALTIILNEITPERVKAFATVVGVTLVGAMIVYKKTLEDVIRRQTMLGWGALATMAGILAAEILTLTGVFDDVDDGLDKVNKSTGAYLKSLIDMKREELAEQLKKQTAEQEKLSNSISNTKKELIEKTKVDADDRVNKEKLLDVELSYGMTQDDNIDKIAKHNQQVQDKIDIQQKEKDAVDESIKRINEYTSALDNGFNTVESYLETLDKVEGAYGKTIEAQKASINAQIEETQKIIDTKGAQEEYVAVLKMLQMQKAAILQAEVQAQFKAYSSMAKGVATVADAMGAGAKEVAAIQAAGALVDAFAGASAARFNANKANLPVPIPGLMYAIELAAGLANARAVAMAANKVGGGASGAGGVYGSFEQGGYVGGNRHSQGGTIIEAERGEFVMSRNAVESIGLETLNQMNQSGGGGSINVSVTGNVLTQDFVEGELAESIKEAVRRGSDFGIG